MMNRISNTMTRSDEGASAVEYGLLIAAIAAVIVGVIFAIGQLVGVGFDDTCEELRAQSSDQSIVCPN